MKNNTDRVTAVLIPKTPENNEYLIAKREDNGNWELPGGKEDSLKDSDLLATAEREIREKLNVVVEPVEYSEEHSFEKNGCTIIPVLSKHNYNDIGPHIKLHDYTKYKWVDPEKMGKDFESEKKCFEAFDLL